MCNICTEPDEEADILCTKCGKYVCIMCFSLIEGVCLNCCEKHEWPWLQNILGKETKDKKRKQDENP